MKDASFIPFITRGLSRMREDAGPLQALVTDICFRARDSAAGSRCGVESRWGLDDHAARTCCPGRVPAPLGTLPRTRVDGRRVGGTLGGRGGHRSASFVQAACVAPAGGGGFPLIH